MFVSSGADRPQPVSRMAGPRGLVLHVVGQDSDCVENIRSVAEPLGMDFKTHRSAEEFLHRFDGERPACLISELRLPGMDALELMTELRGGDGTVPLIVLTQCLNVRTAVAVIRAGALTVLEKPLRTVELREALRQAVVLEQRYREIFSHKREIASRLAELTDQEKAVLELMVNGLPNKSIASRLDVSLRTVEGRRREVFNKLHANSLAEAVRLVTAAAMPVCVCHPQEAVLPASREPVEETAAQSQAAAQLDIERDRSGGRNP